MLQRISEGIVEVSVKKETVLELTQEFLKKTLAEYAAMDALDIFFYLGFIFFISLCLGPRARNALAFFLWHRFVFFVGLGLGLRYQRLGLGLGLVQVGQGLGLALALGLVQVGLGIRLGGGEREEQRGGGFRAGL